MEKRKEHFYELSFQKSLASEDHIFSNDLQKIEVAAPLEFTYGTKNKWTSEHLIAGAIMASLMQTFIDLASKAGLSVTNCNCHCFIRMEKKGEKLIFSELLIRPSIALRHRKDAVLASQLLEKAEASYPVKSSLKIPVEIMPQFEFSLLK